MTILNGVEIRDGRRMIVATVDGERFEFPEAWAVAYGEAYAGTDARDAAVAWHERGLIADDVEFGGG